MNADRRRVQKVSGTVLAACSVVGLLVWFIWFSPGGQSRRELDHARELWEARQPSSYAFDYFYCGGMCAYCPVHVTVTAGVVVDAVMSGEGCDGGSVSDAPTIEDMFEVAADHRPGLLDRSSSATYDPRWGFPALVEFSCPPDTMDCGGGWSVSHFEVLAE